MLDQSDLRDLYPIPDQASRILRYIGQWPDIVGQPDVTLAARIQMVSAQQVATVKRVLLRLGYLEGYPLANRLTAKSAVLERMAANLEGVGQYRRYHEDRDLVRLVITEPGTESAFRAEVDRRAGLPSLLFQTTDAFISLARAAQHEFTVLVPFIDAKGAEFLVKLFSLVGPEVRRCLICRPLTEPHCGPAFQSRRSDFAALNVNVFEYARPSTGWAGRETFHAKILLADEESCYVGSSNLMASALERSLECGVIVSGETARQVARVIDAVKGVATRVQAHFS